MLEIYGLSDALGISDGATAVLLVAVVAIILYTHHHIKDKRLKTKFITISGLLFVTTLALSGSFLSAEEKGLVITEDDVVDDAGQRAWQVDYELVARNIPTYNEDTANTDYYMYNDDIIVAAANKIASESDSAKQAVRKTLEFVYQTVEYNDRESDTPCLQSTASKIIKSGTGQCDTQSIAVISILRKMGIVARPVGGCISVNPQCRLQSLFQSIAAFRTPQYVVPTLVDPGETEFSRTQTLSRSGGLHAYVVAWVPNEGWIALEPTSGKLADTICYNYHVELYPENEQRSDICVSKNYAYAKACQLSDIETMNENGIGLVTEVKP